MWTAIPLLYRILAIALFLGAVAGFGFREGLRYDHDQIVQLQAAQAVASANFKSQVAQIQASQSQVTLKAEQDHAQAITALDNRWALLMRQRVQASGRAVPALPPAPHSINAIPLDALPLGAQCANTTQQLEDLQAWIKAQQSTR